MLKGLGIKKKLLKEIFNKKKSLVIPNINIQIIQFLYKKILSKDLYYIIFEPVYSWIYTSNVHNQNAHRYSDQPSNGYLNIYKKNRTFPDID